MAADSASDWIDTRVLDLIVWFMSGSLKQEATMCLDSLKLPGFLISLFPDLDTIRLFRPEHYTANIFLASPSHRCRLAVVAGELVVPPPRSVEMRSVGVGKIGFMDNNIR